MTPEIFRELALQLPGASEGEHHGHADFRVGGKIFATLGYPTVEFATILLTPEEQASFVQTEPASFVPVPGGWGRKGSTNVRLKSGDRRAVRQALRAAWKRRAPRRLARNASSESAPVQRTGVRFGSRSRLPEHAGYGLGFGIRFRR